MKTFSTFAFALVFILGFGAVTTVVGQNLKGAEYKVVINHEEQYSILLAGKPVPKGWKDAGISGTQAMCQKYIEEVWTDMRPLSIRKMGLADNAGYQVIINHEEQYAVWPAALDLPKDWKTVGVKGNLEKCQEYIEEVWTDMRPLSMRKMERY